MPIATIPSSQVTDGFSDTLPTTFTLASTGVALRSDATYTADAFGCQWTGTAPSMRGAKPAPKEVTGDRPYADGQWNGTQFYGAKSMPITGDCVAPSNAALNAAEMRLKNAVPLSTFPLYVSQAGFEGVVNVRQSGELLWTVVTPTYATFSIGLTADDPRIYSTQTRTFTLSFGASGGPSWVDPGPSWVDPGVDWTDSGGSNTALLVNPGSVAVPLLLTLSAPMTSAQITVQQGAVTQTMNLFNGDPGGGDLLVAGQTLTVDTGRHSVVLNGSSSRRYWRSGQWPLVGPGTSTIYLTGTGAGTVSGSYVAAGY